MPSKYPMVGKYRQSTNIEDKRKASFYDRTENIAKIRREHSDINPVVNKEPIAYQTDGFTKFNNIKTNKEAVPFAKREPFRNLGTKPSKFKFLEPKKMK